MAQKKFTLILFIVVFATTKLFAQANPFISVLPSNSGIVALGATNDLLITVGNTGTASIPVSKLRPIVTVPASVTFLANGLQTGLPAGWTILSNTGAQLRLCNSGDVIPGTSSREIILKVEGVTIAPPTTFSGQINFGNGSTCAAGPTVSGNNTADDFATSTIEVITNPLPLTLIGFSANLLNCQPTLNWITENEINSSRFEIERATQNTSNWVTVGTAAAQGNSTTKFKYNFSDNIVQASSQKVFYRLKMIDRDGRYSYSSILPVYLNCKTVQMNVFPNPVQKGNLYVSITGSNNIEASLISISGQVVSKMSLKNGTNVLDVSNISNGMYILNANFENGTSKKIKVLVQHSN